MELKNTSRLPDAFIEHVLRFVGLTPRPTRLVCRHSVRKPFHGYTRPGHLYVRVDVGDRDRFPFNRKAIKYHGYLGVQLASPEEALVYVLAHELRHLGQYWTRGLLSECDADTFAQVRLNDWRQQ